MFKRTLAFLTLFIFSFSSSSFTSEIQVTTYEQLIQAIRQTRAASQARLEQAANQEKVREAWETGKLIDEHILQHKERADYGTKTIKRLSKDLSISERELYYMLQFARAYPILRTSATLSWAHYETLLSIDASKERDELEEKAAEENWTLAQTREEVQKRKAAKNQTAEPAKEIKLTAQLGKIGTYRVVRAKAGPDAGRLVIDLGFSNYYKTSKELRFKEGDLLETVPAFQDQGSLPTDKIKSTKRTASDLFTYPAYVFEVIDGDTFKAVIDLGFGVRSVQTLRLRGLDAPELLTTEGKEAKTFLEKMLAEGRRQKVEVKPKSPSSDLPSTLDLPPSASVLIRTTKSDKYDRYLADLWTGETYVNQALLDEGLAVRVHD